MKLSALILAKNEQDMITGCLSQLDFVDEIILLDQNSYDNTVKIAKKYTSKIYEDNLPFDSARNALAAYAKGQWLLYLDADERITSDLKKEIISKVIDKQCKDSAFFLPRQNMILGKFLKHGGWWPDYVPRLFKVEKLIKWQGPVHESPQVDGKFGYLKSPLIHLTARSMTKMLQKSAKWAKIEAELYFEKGQSIVTMPKVLKTIVFEFVERYFVKLGFLDGFVGLVESVYQAYHKAMILTYLWELQNDAEGKFKKATSKYL